MEFAETGDEFSAEHPAEYFDGQEETRRRADPAGVIERQATGGNHAMHVRVKEQLLIPGVQDAEESGLRAQVTRITRDRPQRGGAGAKQEVVDLALVLQGQGRQRMRQGEDHVDVAGGEQVAAARRKPAVARVGLALRAVPVAAGVERDGAMTAARTFIDVSAERRRPAGLDGTEDFQMPPGEPLPVAIEERV